jgi:hypothetical protein
MLTLNINYDVLPDRLITIKLPETVRLGRHELVIVVDEQPIPSVHASHNAAKLKGVRGQVFKFEKIKRV